jgi:hypothetical protein
VQDEGVDRYLIPESYLLEEGIRPHPAHEIFSPTVESCSLDAEVTELQGIYPAVAEWRPTSTCNGLLSHESNAIASLRRISSSDTLFRRSNMLGLIARWTHNVLLTSMGLLTIALVVWAT